MLDGMVSLMLLAGVSYVLYRFGKRLGSRKGFGAGLRRARRGHPRHR